MKKFLLVLMILALALTAVCAAAEEAKEEPMDLELANGVYQEYLGRVLSEEDEIGYTVANAEYGELQPLDVDPAPYFTLLQKAKLVAADIAEVPEGEYIVIDYPDQCRLEFFYADAEKNYVRVVLISDTVAAALCQAVFPEDVSMPASGIMQMYANELADANGIEYEEDEEDAEDYIPEEGWVRDSVYGAVWQDDRASLEVVAEGDGFKVLIIWGSSAWETTEWTYACYFDEETQSLKAIGVICDDVVFDDNGNETRTNRLDQECATVFALNEDGQVVITDAVDEQLEGKVFTRIQDEAETWGGLYADIQRESDSPEWIAKLPAAQDATQLFIVAGIGMDKTTAYISMHQKDAEGNWKQILSTPGFVGKNGLCADEDHKEGCAQTPVGVYHFNKAFGIAQDPGCALPYIQVDENTYWSGDPDRQYNQMVDIRDVPDLVMDDSEHIVDYEYQYQYCLNISFNEEGTPGRGSAIFLHCFGPQKPWTGGCVAVPENIMKMIMQRVQEDCVVVIDTLDNLGGSF